MKKENWRPVVGYEGLYEVSDLGNVRSLDRYVTDTRNGTRFYKGKLLKPQKLKTGYYIVTLKKRPKLLHRLVAEAFIPNPDNCPVVNHKDCDTANCKSENLEWCTQQYNVNYNGAPQKRAQYFSKEIKQMNLDGSLVAIWPSLSEAGRNGYSFKIISLCCLGKRKTHKGYLWAYA